MTYQEAHEVKGEDSGDPTKRQALEHRAADPSRATQQETLGAVTVTDEASSGHDEASASRTPGNLLLILKVCQKILP
ncbi:hypothetical protein EYF80_036523 [Liparis tanakae]|uniref:Uncharacterized protein n=1 Tax=Liparis tanakae TaxID=230148 RepID=A0A4Z2GIW5_9TELE|nr:hypothetical protein EYF80_036523 [Liparis tanakae]